MSEHLESMHARLASRGSFFAEDVVAGYPSVIGYEKEFRLRWFATQLNTFIVATDYGSDPVDVATVEGHLHESFRYASRNKRGWPRGLQSSVGAISILISSRVDSAAMRYCEGLKARKKWAGFVIPAVLDAASGQAHFFSRSPVWGRVYFPYFRSLIQDLCSRNGQTKPYSTGA